MTRRRNRNETRKRIVEGKNIGNDDKLISLLKWLKEQNCDPTCRLRPAVFNNTGRGLQALEYIQQNSIVVRIPIHCCVTRHYLKSTIIHSVLGQDFNKYNTQELLATWLAQQTDKQGVFQNDSLKDENKFWRSYLESLPEDYSLPCTCNKEEVGCMPNYLRNRVEKQRADIDSSFNKLRKYFPALDKERYEWGYYTVNTRAVFLQKDPRDNGSGEAGENCLALVPFLDLLNHSDDVSVQAGINLSRESVNCSGFFYEIAVNQSVTKFSEVFICYGKHSNTKLLVEYGFFLGDLNSNEHIEIFIEYILEYLKHNQLILISLEKKLEILHSNGLDLNLGIGSSGLSWNLMAVLHILLLDDNKLSDWFQVYHIEEFSHLSSIFHNFIISYLEYLKNCLNKMNSLSNFSKYFELSKLLVEYHVALVTKVSQQFYNSTQVDIL